ncbi:MAG: AIM24 family protein [Solirubrobacteraceae bacterium]
MPTAPKILPTQIAEGRAPGLAYRLEGELVPVLHMALDGQVPIYFEHHVLLWKYPQMQIGLHPLKKGLKRRMFGGMPLLLLQAESAGEIAFSRDAPGHIVALHLQPGEGVAVREHQFLAATGHVQYDYSRIRGFANMMYGGGFFIDQFMAGGDEGVLWVHGYGNVFEKVLGPGETIDIEPGGWLYRDNSVSMSQEVYGFKTGLLGGGAGQLIFNRFTGPGRVGLQSAYYHPPGAETGGGGGQAQAVQSGGGGLLGNIVGGLLDN